MKFRKHILDKIDKQQDCDGDGVQSPVPGQVGVIHPAADVASIVKHAFSDAQFLCERCYLSAPALELKSHNLLAPDKPVSVNHVPSHIYYMTFEVGEV